MKFASLLITPFLAALLLYPGAQNAQARSAGAFAYSYAYHSCAPWDGPAIEIVLQKEPAVQKAPPSGLPLWSFPRYVVSLWMERPPLGRWITLPSPCMMGGGGTIIEWERKDKCKRHEGRVFVEKWAQEHIDGELRIPLPDATGRELVLPFSAPVFPLQSPCG